MNLPKSENFAVAACITAWLAMLSNSFKIEYNICQPPFYGAMLLSIMGFMGLTVFFLGMALARKPQ
jgi:hypothetical protein